MSITIPSEVSWLLPIVVGQSWPAGDEDAMWRLRDTWKQAAEEIRAVGGDANGVAARVLATMRGEGADAFSDYWNKFAVGGDAAFEQLAKAAESMADACDEAGTQIEYAKLSIIAALIALAIELAATTVAAFFTFGAAEAAAPAEMAATRTIVQTVVRFLIQALRRAAIEAVKQGLIQGLSDLAVQGVQIAEGHRKSVDWQSTAMAAAGGAIGGAVSGLGEKIPMGDMAGKMGMAKGIGKAAAESLATDALTAAATGQDFNLGQSLMHAGSAAAMHTPMTKAHEQLGEFGNRMGERAFGETPHISEPRVSQPLESESPVPHTESAPQSAPRQDTEFEPAARSEPEPRTAATRVEGYIPPPPQREGVATEPASAPAHETAESAPQGGFGSAPPAESAPHGGFGSAPSLESAPRGGFGSAPAAESAPRGGLGSAPQGGGGFGPRSGMPAGPPPDAARPMAAAGSRPEMAPPQQPTARPNYGPPPGGQPGMPPPVTARPPGGFRPDYGPPQGMRPDYGPPQGMRPDYGPPQGMRPDYGPPQGDFRRPEGSTVASGFAPPAPQGMGVPPRHPEQLGPPRPGTEQRPPMQFGPVSGFDRGPQPGGERFGSQRPPQGGERFGQPGGPNRWPGPPHGPDGRPQPQGPRPPHEGQPHPGQPYPGQQHPGQPHAGQFRPAEGFAPNRRPPAPYEGQPHLGQPAPHQGPPARHEGMPQRPRPEAPQPHRPETPRQREASPQHVPAPEPQPAQRQPEPAHEPVQHHEPVAEPSWPDHEPVQHHEPAADPVAAHHESVPGDDPSQHPHAEFAEHTSDFMANQEFEATAQDHQRMRENYLGSWQEDEHDVDRIVAGKPHLSAIPKPEAVALLGLTKAHSHKVINEAFRNGDHEVLANRDAQIRSTVSGLLKMPAVEGPAHRAVTVSDPEVARRIADSYREGEVVTEHTFTHTTMGGNQSKFHGKVEFHYEHVRAHDISELSYRPQEREGVVPPGTSFLTTHKEFDAQTGTWHIYQREVPTPRDEHDNIPVAPTKHLEDPQPKLGFSIGDKLSGEPAGAEPVKPTAAPTHEQTLAEHENPVEHERGAAQHEHQARKDPEPEDTRSEIERQLNPGKPEPEPVREDYIGNPDFHASAKDHETLRRMVSYDEETGGKLALQRVFDRADALHRAHPELPPQGVFAVHAYTTHSVYHQVNQACRTGVNLEHYQHHAKAIIEGMRHMPVFEGETVRRINFTGDDIAAAAAAGHYEEGRIVVETQLNSASAVTGGHTDSVFPGEVKLTVKSRTGRDISSLASKPDEREVVTEPGAQLLVTSKKLVQVEVVDREDDGTPKTNPDGSVKTKLRNEWHIEAEEVAPGDPRRLPPEQAAQQMAHRRELAAQEQRRHAEYQGRTIDSRINPGEHPVERPGAHVAEHPGEHAGGPEPVAGHGLSAGQHDAEFATLAAPTNPPSRAAIHAGTGDEAQQRRYVEELFPELGKVNGENYANRPAEDGYQTNCTRCVVANEQRMRGEDAVASPLHPDEVEAKGTLEFVQRALGGTWENHGSFDALIDRMGDLPVGSRGVVAFKFTRPDGTLQGHVVTVVHGEHGVAFIDPQTGGLASLPAKPHSVQLLPYHPPASVHEAQTHAPQHESPSPEHHGHEGGYGRYLTERVGDEHADPMFAAVMDSLVQSGDEESADRISAVMAEHGFTEERARAVWVAYARCESRQERSDFAANFAANAREFGGVTGD